ncbi:hypothetical protein [Pseudomonas putida]|uniref:hypothetical protein n=1 Tax=Pseudomonas putida TaxID=303 RepID=UPI001C220651|nr:hypothetical protein [Pseudomonas putida]
MRGDTEDSSTKKKVMSFHSTDGFAFFVACVRETGNVVVSIGMEDGQRDIELSRAEALEVAEFIKRGA